MQEQFKKHHKTPESYFESFQVDLPLKRGPSWFNWKLMRLSQLALVVVSIILVLYLIPDTDSQFELAEYENLKGDELEAFLVSEMTTDELMTEYSNYYDSQLETEYEDYLLDYKEGLLPIEEYYQ